MAYALTNYSVKRAMKELGGEGIASMLKEMRQIHEKAVMHPVHYRDLSKSQLKKKIRSLMFTKLNRDGTVKSRFCADGSTQERSSETDVSSPTVSSEALFITAAIDAHDS